MEAKATGLRARQFRLVANVEAVRHDLLVEAEATGEQARRFVRAFDRSLHELNVEYAAKRRSGRLRSPCLHLMRPGWSRRAEPRDPQRKWAALLPAWDEATRSEVMTTVDAVAPSPTLPRSGGGR